MGDGMESAYADYSEGISVDYTGESLDDEEEEEDEELLEEAVEILDLAEQGYEGEAKSRRWRSVGFQCCWLHLLETPNR